MKKQILILEEIGVARADFMELFVKAKLPLALVWSEKEVKSKNNIVGLITAKTAINKAMINKYPELKFIAVAFTGYDKVDLIACRKKNIAVYNVPEYATDSVAELTLGLAISLLRRIPAEDKIAKQGGWDFGAPGNDLKEKTVGIIGTGAIGLKTAELFKAFGCRLIGWSRTPKDRFKQLGGVYIKDLIKLLSMADIVSLHLPLSKETAGFFGAKEIVAMKKSAYLINTARGAIINQPVLVRALKNKAIAGVALDVFAEEPLAKNDPLRKLSNVILTPHIAFKTAEALNRRAQITVDNIKNFFNNKKENRVA